MKAVIPTAAALWMICGPTAAEPAGLDAVTLGPRPLALVDAMAPGQLKDRLAACEGMPARRAAFSIGHRGAALLFPEHTRESYLAAARMGAGAVECDATFTADGALVCRHAQCDLHETTDILLTPLAAKCAVAFSPASPATGAKAQARCCASDLTLDEMQSLRGRMEGVNPDATTLAGYLDGTPRWRSDLNAPGALMSHAGSIALLSGLGVDFIPELKGFDRDAPPEDPAARDRLRRRIVADYVDAGVDPRAVRLQSFELDDIRFWLREAPAFGAGAIWLDGRYRNGVFDPARPATWTPSMEALRAEGLTTIAPPIWVLVTLDAAGAIVPSAYARAARAAGLRIVTWTLERSGSLAGGGGWYYRSVAPAIRGDGDVFVVLDVLAREVGVEGVFSDWPATTTFYANCMGLD